MVSPVIGVRNGRSSSASVARAALDWLRYPGLFRETAGMEGGQCVMADLGYSRKFSDEFKRQIVEMYNADKPPWEIMEEHGLGRSTL